MKLPGHSEGDPRCWGAPYWRDGWRYAGVFTLYPDCLNTSSPTKDTPQKELQRLAGATAWAIKPYTEKADLSEAEQAVYNELQKLLDYYFEKLDTFTGINKFDCHPLLVGLRARRATGRKQENPMTTNHKIEKLREETLTDCLRAKDILRQLKVTSKAHLPELGVGPQIERSLRLLLDAETDLIRQTMEFGPAGKANCMDRFHAAAQGAKQAKITAAEQFQTESLPPYQEAAK